MQKKQENPSFCKFKFFQWNFTAGNQQAFSVGWFFSFNKLRMKKVCSTALFIYLPFRVNYSLDMQVKKAGFE